MDLSKELKRKRDGFVMLPVILATFIVGLLGVGLSAVYSGSFATMSAAKSSMEAANVASLEKEILQAKGYGGYNSEITGWKSMGSVLGDNSTPWEYTVQKVKEQSVGGDNIAVVKVSVRKKGDSVIRYSEEVPLSSKSANRYIYNDSGDRISLKYEKKDGKPYLLGYAPNSSTNVPFYVDKDSILAQLGNSVVYNTTPSATSSEKLNLKYMADSDGNMAVHAFMGNTEVPLASQGSNIRLPDYSTGILFDYNTENTNQSYSMPDDGWFYFYIFAYLLPYNGCIRVNGHIVYSSAGSTIEAANDITGVIPVSKGDIVTVKSYYSSSTSYVYDGQGFTVDGRGLTQLIFYKNKS